MEPQNPSNSPKPRSEVVERRATNKQAAQRDRAWTVQYEIRDVMHLMTVGAAWRFVKFAPPKSVTREAQVP